MYTAVFIGKPAKYGSYYAYGPFVVFRTLAKTDSLPITRYTRCSSRRVCLLSTVVLCYILLRVLQTFRGKRP